MWVCNHSYTCPFNKHTFHSVGCVCRRTSWSMPRSDVICTVELNMLPAEHLIVRFLADSPAPNTCAYTPGRVIYSLIPNMLCNGPTRRYRLQVSISVPIYLSILDTRTNGPPHLTRGQVPMGPAITIDVNIPSAHPSPSATSMSTTNVSKSIHTLY